MVPKRLIADPGVGIVPRQGQLLSNLRARRRNAVHRLSVNPIRFSRSVKLLAVSDQPTRDDFRLSRLLSQEEEQRNPFLLPKPCLKLKEKPLPPVSGCIQGYTISSGQKT